MLCCAKSLQKGVIGKRPISPTRIIKVSKLLEMSLYRFSSLAVFLCVKFTFRDLLHDKNRSCIKEGLV